VSRDGVGQPRAQHDELVLPLVFWSANSPPHGVIQTPELALGSAIHIAHADDHSVRLVIQVQAVGHELLELDFGEPIERAPASAAGTAFMTTFGSAATRTAIIAPRTALPATISASIFASILSLSPRRPIPSRFAALAMLGH